MSLLTLLVLLSLSPAQEAQDYQLQPSPQSELARNFIAHRAQQALLDHIQIDRVQSSDGGCFFIRSYIFRSEDGGFPVLVGTTTCTPSNKVRNRTVKRNPRLVPLN